MTSPAPSRESEALARVRRLKDDFRFWAACCYRIRTKSLELQPLRLNGVQIEIEAIEQEELRRHGYAWLYVLKGRQSGVTTAQQAKSLHTIFRKSRADALTLAHTQKDTSDIFEITRRAIDNFPPALLPTIGSAHTNEISFIKRDSRFWTGTAGAKGTGRGKTLTRFHGSEFGSWSDPLSTLGAVTPALEGVPGAVIVLETTASGYGSAAHAFWKQAVQGETGYRPIFIPWWRCDPERYRQPLEAPDELGTLADHERFLVEKHGLTMEEIKWRRAKVRYYGLGGFLKEYPEDDEGCWMVAGDLFYNKDTLLSLAQRAPTPIAYIPPNGREQGREVDRRPWSARPEGPRQDGEVWIYGEPAQGDRGVISGADTAEGIGGDASTYVQRAFPSWRLLEDYHSRTVEPKPFAALLDQRSRGRSVYQVIERNLHGTTVLRELRDAGYPRKMIYHRAPLDDRNPDSRSDRMGWHTNPSSYGVLLDAGRDLFHEAAEGRVPAPAAQTIRDGFAVQRDKDGSVSLTGKDMLVSELLAWIGRTAPRAG